MCSVGEGGSPQPDPPVCVTGATGYVGSWLVRTLLRRGRHVHATARDPGTVWRLRVFRADMGEEGSFDDAARGCAGLFHVAASMDLHLSPDDQHEEERVRSQVLEPATRGTINVLWSCVRVGTIRRVVFTSSISTMTAMMAGAARREEVVDESCVRPLDDVWTTKPIGWIYIMSKLLAEEAAFNFARDNGMHLVSVVLPSVAGPFLTPGVRASIHLLLSPITRDAELQALLASVHGRFGCVPLAHIHDACDAHVFLMEAPHANGRYLCAAGSYPMARIVRLLSSHYRPFRPAERLSEDFGGSDPSSVVSTKKLVDLGFKFEYDVGDIVRDSVEQCVHHGFLHRPDDGGDSRDSVSFPAVCLRNGSDRFRNLFLLL